MSLEPVSSARAWPCDELKSHNDSHEYDPDPPLRKPRRDLFLQMSLHHGADTPLYLHGYLRISFPIICTGVRTKSRILISRIQHDLASL